LRLLKRAFAGGLLRLERLRLTFGVGDGALAAGKPGKASGEDDGEKHHGRCEAEADALDEVSVGSREDRLLRSGIEMLDRPAGPDLAGVSAGVRVPDKGTFAGSDITITKIVTPFPSFFVNPSSWPAVQKYLHSVSSSARQSTAKDLCSNGLTSYDVARVSPIP
jgi:hypothetical protein